MRFRSLAVLAMVAPMSVAVAQGQPNSTCAASSTPVQVRDACQQAADMFQLMMPQLGISITGGNATLGQGGTLGGLPHFSLGVRGNVLAGSVPDVQDPDTTGIQRRNPYPTKDQILGLPAVTAAIGLFKGIPLALTNVGGVDLLLNAAYVPNVDANNISLAVDNPLKIGYGLRVGLLQESLLIPGVSVTWFKRDLPTTTLTANNSTTNGVVTVTDTLQIKDFAVKTTAWRIVASKSLLLLGFAAGYGQDKYETSTAFRATVVTNDPLGVQSYTTGNVPLSQSLTRSNMFADVTINLVLLKIVGEVGRVSGGTVNTYNVFDPPADAARNYASAGIRIGF